MKPARFPLPHWCIWDCPALETVSAPVHRAVCQIAVAYWRGGCDGLPPDDISLAILAKLPLQHFAPIKPAVVRVLADILPQLDAEHADYARRHARAVKQAQAMTAIRVSRRASRRPTGVSDQWGPLPPTLPQLATPQAAWARVGSGIVGGHIARGRDGRLLTDSAPACAPRPEIWTRADISSRHRAAPLAHSRGLPPLAALQRRECYTVDRTLRVRPGLALGRSRRQAFARAQKRRG